MKSIITKNIMIVISILTIFSSVTVMASNNPHLAYSIYTQGDISKLYIRAEGLPSDTVSLEISLSGDDTENINSNIKWENSQNVMSKKEGKKITLYIVSNDKNTELHQIGSYIPVGTISFDSKNINIENITASMKYIDKNLNLNNIDNVIIKKIETSSGYETTTETTTKKKRETTTEEITETTTEETTETTTKEKTTETTTEETKKQQEKIKQTFNDTKSHWAKKSISYMTQKGYLSGYSDGSFKPNNVMTRAEFSSIISRIFDLKSSGKTVPFKDIAKGAWYENATKSMYEAGIIMGISSDIYGVNNPIKNEDLAVMLDRIMKKFNIEIGIIKTDKISFIDAYKIKNYAKPSVQFLYERGLLYGNTDGTYAPQKETTRAQVAVFLARILPYIE